MTIKSLLLGSAAGLFAVSGAQAADAIIAAAPEPVEYVRVCDAFGTGFFYIPGTETCLRIHGYVRHDIAGGELFGRDTDDVGEPGFGVGDSWAKNSRLSLRTSTATDTELGTLRTYTETRFNYNNADGQDSNWTLNYAWIELGGLRVGKDESVFTTWTGYAGAVINDTTPFGYGPFDTQLISYTFDAGNGFSAIVSLEDDIGVHDGEAGTIFGADDGYVPDVVAGAKYEVGAFGLSVVGAFDESVGEGAIKARLDADFGGFSAFVMGAMETGESATNRFVTWGGDWAVWVGGSAPITETVTFNTQLLLDDEDNFGAIGNLVFNVTEGFAVTTEVGYADNIEDDGLFGDDDDGQFGGIIRFQRSF